MRITNRPTSLLQLARVANYPYPALSTAQIAGGNVTYTIGHTHNCTMVGGFPSNSGPCLVVGNQQVTVWLTHNGNMRM